MNVKLLKEFIGAAIETIVVPVLQADGGNSIDFYCSDVVGNKRFAQNYGCYPRSEIAEINAQADIRLQAAMLADLTDYSSDVDFRNAGLSDQEILLSHRSKYCQCPTEQQRWLENQLAIRDAKRSSAALEGSSSKEANIDFQPSDVNNGAE